MPEERSVTEDCPPDMALVELYEGRLAEADAARLRRHAERCSRCHAALAGLAAGAPEEIGATRTVEAPPERGAGASGDGIARAIVDGGASIGRTVDRKYRLLRYLGAGGMGSVYEAEHAGTGRRVAVKIIHGHLHLRGDDARGRFRREARVVGAIDSPHVVEILDAGEDEATGDLYLVMEHLRGEDLQRLIDRVGPRPDVALRIAAQALAGLGKAHARGIVHRDIKPANLFLARSGEGGVTVKLLDFGIAKVSADAPYAGEDGARVRTTDGLLGSPLYMSPEQVQSSGEVDPRTDLWSLGSVLYCALAGRAPFERFASVGRLIVAISSSAPPPLRQAAPWVPPAAEEAVGRALAVRREDRWPSAAAMLEAVLASLPDGTALREEMLVGVAPDVRARAAAPSPRSRRRLWIAAGVVAGSALAATILRWPEAARGTGAIVSSRPAISASPPPPAGDRPPPIEPSVQDATFATASAAAGAASTAGRSAPPPATRSRERPDAGAANVPPRRDAGASGVVLEPPF